MPEGQSFHAALGHFNKNAETGRKLYGTASIGTKTSGPRTEGLLQVMGYTLPPGGARARRSRIVRQALASLRAVVEEALGGIIAGKHDGRWLTLTDIVAGLRDEEILKRVTWFLFVPAHWLEKQAQDIQHYHAERHACGETPYKVKVTRDRGERERAEAGRRGEHYGEGDGLGLAGEPLRVRLRAKRKELDLSQGAVGKVFGVTHVTVGAWERESNRMRMGSKANRFPLSSSR